MKKTILVFAPLHYYLRHVTDSSTSEQTNTESTTPVADTAAALQASATAEVTLNAGDDMRSMTKQKLQ